MAGRPPARLIGQRHCPICDAPLQEPAGRRLKDGRTYCRRRECILTGIGWPLDFDPRPLLGYAPRTAPNARKGGGET